MIQGDEVGDHLGAWLAQQEDLLGGCCRGYSSSGVMRIAWYPTVVYLFLLPAAGGTRMPLITGRIDDMLNVSVRARDHLPSH